MLLKPLYDRLHQPRLFRVGCAPGGPFDPFENLIPFLLANRSAELCVQVVHDLPTINQLQCGQIYLVVPEKPAIASERDQVIKCVSLFLDENFVPYPDQWAFLSSLRQMNRKEVEEIVGKAKEQGELLGIRIPVTDENDDAPWTAPPSRQRKEPPIIGPFPEQIDLVLGNQVYVPKKDLEEEVVEQTTTSEGKVLTLANGWQLSFKDLTENTKLPKTLNAKKL